MAHNCFIEYLPNIRQLVVLLQINADNVENDSKLYIDKTGKCLHTDSNAQNSDLLISVPGCILLERLLLPLETVDNFPQINRIDNVLILQFRNVTPLGNLITLSRLQSAKSLQGTCQEFVCSNCLNSLKRLDSSNTFYDLPNEHWLELLDCWSCHDNEFAPIAERALNQKIHNHEEYCHKEHCAQDEQHCSAPVKSYHEISNSSNGLILPSVGRIYLGSSFILMNINDFSFETCSSCDSVIGERVHDSHMKLYRDSIRFKFNDSSACAQESFTAILMHRILDTIDNHSTFHFVLRASETHRLYLRPINWNLLVFDFDAQNWHMAFKLGFAELSEASSHAEADTINCTASQFKLIKDQIQLTYESNLFNSSLKFPGSESSLKLAYLIN